jgi:dihydrolipoamide dehydrogenase
VAADERFDAVVIGAGPGGEVAVSRLAAAGLRVALAERELIGGECAYWGCIPSKTLLRPAEVRVQATRTAGTGEPPQRWPEIAAYRDFMIRHLDDARQVEGYRSDGVAVHKAPARIAGPGRVEVGGAVLRTERIVVATGSEAALPPIEGLRRGEVWTNREATTFERVPEDVVVLGGGPTGLELGQMLRRYGARVTVVEAGERLLAREDPAVGELIGRALAEEGIDVRVGARAARVEAEGARRVVRLDDGERLGAEQLLVTTGRRPRLEGLGLESVGVEAGRAGVGVDERCRAGEGVWAVGDVTGVAAFTHVAKYQARVACEDILGRPARADYRAIPRVVFTDPEIAAVGLGESVARSRGIEVAVVRIDLPELLARPWTYERDPRGELTLVADRARGVLVGAWAVAPLASEWIHHAVLAIRAEIPLATLLDTPAQFPTYAEGYVAALERLAG